MPLVEQELMTTSYKSEYISGLFLALVLINFLFSWCTLYIIVCFLVHFIAHCIVCPSSIYGFWLLELEDEVSGCRKFDIFYRSIDLDGYLIQLNWEETY